MPKVLRDEDIFQVVRQVIIAHGYAGATTKQIADAANISEMTLFRRYNNKAQLVIQAFSAITKQIDFESATQYTGDAAADLTRVVEHYQALVDQHGPFMVVLLSEIPRYDELSELLDHPFNIMQDIAQMITRYQNEGILNQENAFLAVTALLGPMIYNVMISNARPDGHMPPINVAEHIDKFLTGRCTR